jgi:hypothetical protein
MMRSKLQSKQQQLAWQKVQIESHYHMTAEPSIVCYKETQRRNEGRGEERKQEIERHTQGTEPTPQPRPTQNTAEAAKATQEHKPTGTKKRNNHTRHKPEKPRTPKATRSDTKQKATTAAQNRERRTKKGRCAKAGLGGAGQIPTPEPAKPRQQGGTRPTTSTSRYVLEGRQRD